MPLATDKLAGLTHLASGKVRELFAVDDAEGNPAILLVASDRISAFDIVLPTEIPDKGAVLTALSLWWFTQLADIVPGHVISAHVADYPPALRAHAEALRGRSMLCTRLDMAPVECVVRGYLTGSGFKDYQASGAVSGHPLPAGLRDGDRLPEPIYTPSTKAPIGEHDENITRAQAEQLLGLDTAHDIERITLAIYTRASELAAASGILLADTKIEIGRDRGGQLVLGDEVLTPDSSRFWPADAWAPGHSQLSYDKQYVRDWLTGSGHAGRAVELPQDVVAQTRARYIQAYERLTGSSFDDYLRGA